MSLRYANDNYKNLGGKVVPVPYEIDEQVARIKLSSLGMAIDSLTEEQKTYLDSWAEH
jgi:adenosylhomocysteinase